MIWISKSLHEKYSIFNLNFTKQSTCYFSVPQTTFEINFLNYYERQSVIQVNITVAI